MLASCLYWKGLQLRNTERWPGLEKWLGAFEQRQSYQVRCHLRASRHKRLRSGKHVLTGSGLRQATKSDYYTHVRDIPPQYGPGYADKNDAVEAAAAAISGLGGSWRLPLDLTSKNALEPLPPYMNPGWSLLCVDSPCLSNPCQERFCLEATESKQEREECLWWAGEEAARHEAAFKLVGNLDAIVRFCCRAAGTPGSKQFSAPLADPYANPNMDWAPEVLHLILPRMPVHIRPRHERGR